MAIINFPFEKKEGKYYVQVLKSDKPEPVVVTVGLSTLEKVEILSGLQVGDQLVLSVEKDKKQAEE